MSTLSAPAARGRPSWSGLLRLRVYPGSQFIHKIQ